MRNLLAKSIRLPLWPDARGAAGRAGSLPPTRPTGHGRKAEASTFAKGALATMAGAATGRRRLGRAGRWVSALALMSVSAAAWSQSFGTCNARMFLGTSNEPPSSSTLLQQINMTTNPFSYTAIGSSVAPPYDAIAYNPADNFIYGITYDNSPKRLVRIASNGAVTVLGTITPSTGGSFPDNTNFAGGAFSPSGEYYISKRSPDPSTLYRVNLTTRVATPVSTAAAFGSIIDFAFVGNDLYGPGSFGQLYRVNVSTGAATSVGSGGVASAAPSAWGFANGGFYTLNSGNMYQWNLTTGRATLIGTGPVTGHADGTNCPTASLTLPVDLSVTKTNTPGSGPNDLANDTYVPGQARTYTIVVRNTGPFGAQGVTVSDPLPTGIASASWTCSATGGGVCPSTSGSGAINQTTVVLPVNATVTYLLAMTVPAGYTGNLVNTATVTPGPTNTDTNTSNNSATDTDQRAPQLTVRKISLGGVGSFGFSGTNGVATQTLTTTTAGTAVSGAIQTLTTPSTTTTVTEGVPPANYQLTDISCTGLGAGGTATPNLGTRTVTLNAAATAPGADIVCTFTNQLMPRLTVRKISLGGVGSFGFSGSNGVATQTLTTTTAGTAVAGAIQTLTAASTTTTVTEGVPPANYQLTDISCTGLGAGGAATPNLGTRTVSLNAAATAPGANIVCTFTNQLMPRLTVRKISLGGVGSFGFSGSNGVATQTLTTTTAGTAVAGAIQTLTAASTATTITEGVPPANYQLTDIACTGLGAGGAATPNLGTRTVSLNAAATAPGANIVCTFTNTLQVTDLQVVKTGAPNPVLSGGVVGYSIVLTNNGPQAASNVLLTDSATPGQNCTVPSSTATCAATGGASCPSPTVPVSALLGSGVTIPSLPVGGQVTVTLQCSVSASGMP